MANLLLKDGVRSYLLGETPLTVLNGVSLEIQPGEFVAIMGPSGSGKSTLMNVLGCLDQLSSGQYFVANQDVTQLSSDQLAEFRRVHIGFIFQTFNLISTLTAVENVALPMIYNRANDIEIAPRQLLEKVGLGHRMDHLPSQLSGGERQRVAVARALVNDPAIILADEPTGNLDSVSGEQVMAMIQDLHQLGKTIILVTHDAVVASHAQKIIHIKDGRIEKIEALTP